MSGSEPLGIMMALALMASTSFVGMCMLIKIAFHLEDILKELRKR